MPNCHPNKPVKLLENDSASVIRQQQTIRKKLHLIRAIFFLSKHHALLPCSYQVARYTEKNATQSTTRTPQVNNYLLIIVCDESKKREQEKCQQTAGEWILFES